LGIVSRIFVLILLAVDYANDPGPFVSPLASELGSTPVWCVSFTTPSTNRRLADESDWAPETLHVTWASSCTAVASAAVNTAHDAVGRPATFHESFLLATRFCIRLKHFQP
jgi:hypothetical protein